MPKWENSPKCMNSSFPEYGRQKVSEKKFSVNDRKLDFGGIDFFAFRAKTFAGISDYILWSRT